MVLCLNKRCRFNMMSNSKFVVDSDTQGYYCVLCVSAVDENGKCAFAEYDKDDYSSDLPLGYLAEFET